MRRLVAALLALGFVANGWGQKLKEEDISPYIVDITGGAVSAGGLVGIEQSAIQQIQTSQDVVVALKPFASGDAKGGFGLAITPARTSFLAMSADGYLGSPLMRALGSLTLSYAETTAEISAVNYRKNGVSADVFFYRKLAEDPIAIAHLRFAECNERPDMRNRQSEALGAAGKAKIALERAQAAGDKAAIEKAQGDMDKAEKAYNDIVIKCMDEGAGSAHKDSPWNATRFAVSLGSAWIRPEAGGARESLGRALTFGGTLQHGERGAIQAALRRTNKEVDLATLGGPVQHKSSSLLAVRYTYGTKEDNGDTKGLVEVSNAKKSEVTEANRVFKYAVGLDKKVSKGAWLQVRLGRNRTIDGTSTETTVLTNISIQPTSGLFK